MQLFRALDVKHEPLSLIPPQFEQPLPPLNPAVFPPSLREPPGPSLELFDLDEHFATEKVRLAYLANKCNDAESATLDYFIREGYAPCHTHTTPHTWQLLSTRRTRRTRPLLSSSARLATLGTTIRSTRAVGSASDPPPGVCLVPPLTRVCCHPPTHLHPHPPPDSLSQR